ncbi:hypothetical protein BCR44DRAFT_37814 [Catenaria anguillulae PL171]|uniref:Uncharacterized protein n=1 Tax=Catenaria anguillulae PL171 TaxID=765915 RepID=A0A1Y2HXB2_9FUNG|nr:hypothetical protein BCR44DRAFT_37814 [Catenaria anguillulae PL171]
MSSSAHFNAPAGSDHGPSSSWIPIVTGIMIVPVLVLIGLMMAPQNTLFDVKSVPSIDARLRRSASKRSTASRARSTIRSGDSQPGAPRTRSKSSKRTGTSSGGMVHSGSIVNRNGPRICF